MTFDLLHLGIYRILLDVFELDFLQFQLAWPLSFLSNLPKVDKNLLNLMLVSRNKLSYRPLSIIGYFTVIRLKWMAEFQLSSKNSFFFLVQKNLENNILWLLMDSCLETLYLLNNEKCITIICNCQLRPSWQNY